MLKYLFLALFTFCALAEDNTSIEDQLMGTVEMSEQDYLVPMSEIENQYKHSLDEKTDKLVEFEGEQFPEINFKDIHELRQKEKKSIIQIIRSAPASKLNLAEQEALKVQLSDIIKSGTVLASIQKGTQLVHVRTGKLHYAQKDLIVRAYRLKDSEGYRLLQSKNGFISYKSPATSVIKIKEVTSMHETPLKYKPVQKQIKIDINNKQVEYETHFLLNAGLTRPMFLRDLINDETHYGQTVRYEATAYGRWDFPLKTGLTMQWENNFGTFDDGKYTMQTLSLGPSFKSMPFKLITNEYYFMVQTRLAVFSQIAVTSLGSTAGYRNSQTNLMLGLIRKIQTILGDFLIGVNYQRQWIKASASQQALDINSENNYNDALAISIGHGSDWIW